MEIEFLKYLEENPIKKGISNDWPIKPIPLCEIETLETTYNNGNPFPKALRELLYLAGEYCYVLDYGVHDSQGALQIAERQYLIDQGNTISRPFYVIDCYNDYDQFLFVYLDEGDNPPVYEFMLGEGSIRMIDKSLSIYINKSIDLVKRGINPF